jgi:hypothetical protein
MSDASRKLKEDEINSAISLLEFLLHNGDQITQLKEEQRVALMKAAGQLSRPDKKEIKKRNKAVKFTRKQANILSDKKNAQKPLSDVRVKMQSLKHPNSLEKGRLKKKKKNEFFHHREIVMCARQNTQSSIISMTACVKNVVI